MLISRSFVFQVICFSPGCKRVSIDVIKFVLCTGNVCAVHHGHIMCVHICTGVRCIHILMLNKRNIAYDMLSLLVCYRIVYEKFKFKILLFIYKSTNIIVCNWLLLNKSIQQSHKIIKYISKEFSSMVLSFCFSYQNHSIDAINWQKWVYV